MGKRADRKKQRRQIKVGDRVTWGFKLEVETVLEVLPLGVRVTWTNGPSKDFFVPFDRYDVEVVRVLPK